MSFAIRRKLRATRHADPQGISHCYGKLHGKTDNCRKCEHSGLCQSSMEADKPVNRYMVSITPSTEAEMSISGENHVDNVSAERLELGKSLKEIFVELSNIFAQAKDLRVPAIILMRLSGISYRKAGLRYGLSRQQIHNIVQLVKPSSPALWKYLSQNKIGLDSDEMYDNFNLCRLDQRKLENDRKHKSNKKARRKNRAPVC